MRIPKSRLLYLSAAAMALFGGGVAAASTAYKTVTVQDNGQRKVIRGFTTAKVGSFLKVHHIQLSNSDHISPALDASVKDGMIIQIEHPKSITLVDGEKETHWETFAKTVGDFLDEKKIRLNDDDRLNLSNVTDLTDGTTIRITRLQRQTETKTQEIPFQTIRQRTDKLYIGQTKVLTHGVKGSEQIQTTSVFINGHKVTESQKKKVVKHAVNEVIAVGTRPKPVTLSARGVGTLLVRKRLTVVATAYSSSGHTATGLAARPGIIAVDPRVIPLGTKVYIPGVGICRAEDTGGAIKGNRIDICMATEAQARQWGVRTVTISEIE